VHLGREPLLLEASDTNSLQQLREEVAAMLVLSLTDLRLRGNKALLSDLALVADAARDSPDDALEIFAELRLPSGEWPESPGVPQQQASNGPAGPSLTSSEASGDSLQAVSKKPHAEKPPAVPSVERYCLACGRSAAQAGRKMLRCSRCKAATYCGMRCQRAHWVFHQERCGAASAVESQRAGRTGLRNLGFTCYLNSALQILSQTPEIARHLISDAYLEEINRDNVLGTKGELASLVARVLQSMWFGNRSAVDPSALVEGVSRWSQGRFVARTQHDSQEFVSFVLDGLHEDLNRVRQKPYAPLGDSRGRPDDEVAREHWQGHLLRNQSVVVDHFHGQFKSTLMCPQCENVSVTFDPFLTVSLPIPDATLRLVSVNLHEAAGGRPTRYFVPVSAKSTVQQLKESLCEMVREARGRSIAPGQLVVAEVVQARLARLLGGGKPMSALSVKAVLDVFETSCTSQSERAERGLVQLLVTFRAVCSPGADDKSSAPTADAFGWPLVIDVAADLSAGALRDLLWLRHVSRLFHGSSGSAAPAFVALRRDRGVASVAEGEALSLDAPLARQARDREQLAFDVPASFFAAAFDQHEAATVDVQRRSEAVEERKARETTLDKCLKQFTLAETLDGTETWRCSACKQHVVPSKKMELWRLPDVLVIHLKRFKTVQSIVGLGGVRLDTPIDFPIVGLDLSEFLPPSALVGTARPVYDLFGVINHYGTLSNGHYTAAALASNESRSRGGAPVFNTDGACHWVLFDDSSVEAMDAARLDRQAAYVLFYRRRRGAA
jgi:ubiquitin carboxyl-terminal hydrolase 4/11/15